jgi:hypothetical protein
MADGSNRFIAYARETVEGTAPAGAYQTLRTTGGSGIANERTNVTSNEIRADRQIVISRLGQNQPNTAIPFEFSYESYDDMLDGALGGGWIGNYELSETVTIGAASNTITLDDASSWAEKGVAVGDYIILRNADSDDGVYQVSAVQDSGGTDDQLVVTGTDGSTVVSFTGSAADAVNVDGGAWGGSIDASVNNITVVATALTVTIAGTTWSDINIGDAIYFTGFSNAGNNGYKRVTAVTSTVITLDANYDTMVDETLSSGDMDYVVHSALLTVGLDLPTFTLEEGFTDIAEYHYSAGCKVGSMNMSIQPDSIVTGSFDFQGMTYSGMSGVPQHGSLLTADANSVFDSYTGNLYFGEDLVCTVTGIDFTLDNGLNRRYALMRQDACSIGEGRSNVTGTVNAYFPNSNLFDKYNDEDIFEVRIQLEDLSDNSYTFGWPRMKFTSASRDVTENDVTQSLGFMALGGDTTYTNMYVRKQPNIPA